MKITSKIIWELIDKNGNVIDRREDHNIIVKTGFHFILDFIANVGRTAYGSGCIYISHMALGSSNATNVGLELGQAGYNGPSEEDWRLSAEGTLDNLGGGSPCRVEFDQLIHPPVRVNEVLTVTGVFTDGDFPVLPYEIREMGLFLSDTPPTADPRIDPTQLPHSMISRVVRTWDSANQRWIENPYTKQNDLTDLRIRYSLELSND